MPKSYKTCLVKEFSTEQFSDKPLYVNSQQSLEQVDRPPSTSIWRSRDRIEFKDFDTYDIEHEREEDVVCRIGSNQYNKIIRKGFIKAHYSQDLALLLLSGKKADILDFCRKTKDFSYIKIQTINIDMKQLLERLASVKLVWFRFPQGVIHASALMGDHVESTAEFRKYEAAGDISTLSFHFQVIKDNSLHPIMVTRDGAIVLQQTYQNLSTEVEIVLDIKQALLDGIYSAKEIN